jgi:PPP family 3-phenylpropionic acid transporter
MLYTFFIVPVLPLWEATVLEKLDLVKKDYGQVRLWGSLGFILLSLVVGLLLEFQPASVIIIVFLFLSFLNFGILKIGPASVSSVVGLQRLDLSWIKGGKLLIFLMSCALMQASHGTYYAFFTVFMSESNHSHLYIGFLWTIGVAFEVAFMIYAGKLIRRFSYEFIFSLTFLATALRWGLSSVVSGGPVFIFIQGLHGLSFGLFHVCAVTWIARLVPRAFQTTAQSLFSSATYGVGGIVGFLMNAFLYDDWGAQKLWMLDCFIALAGFGLSLIFVLIKNKK